MNQVCFVVSLAVHDERQVFAVGRLTGHRGVDERADVGPDFGPDIMEGPAERAADAWRRESPRTGRCRESRAPPPTRRTSGTATAAGGATIVRRDCGHVVGRPKRRDRPVMRAHQGAHLSATCEKPLGLIHRLRRRRRRRARNPTTVFPLSSRSRVNSRGWLSRPTSSSPPRSPAAGKSPMTSGRSASTLAASSRSSPVSMQRSARMGHPAMSSARIRSCRHPTSPSSSSSWSWSRRGR